jgi:hypothetical protein
MIVGADIDEKTARELVASGAATLFSRRRRELLLFDEAVA